jgi:hypothetical protein
VGKILNRVGERAAQVRRVLWFISVLYFCMFIFIFWFGFLVVVDNRCGVLRNPVKGLRNASHWSWVFWRRVASCGTFAVSQKFCLFCGRLLMRIYAPFIKTEEQRDGLRVWGVASSEERDSDGEIVRADAIRGAIAGYVRYGGTGALREQHRADIAAGLVDEIYVDDSNLTRISGLVVDDGTRRKVKAGVLKGFSLGGRATERNPSNPSEITAIELREISLCDRPSNPLSLVTMMKGAAMTIDDNLLEETETETEAQRRMNHGNPNYLTGEADFSATLGRAMREIVDQCSREMTIALTAASLDLKREIDGVARRVEALSSDPGGRTGLRSPNPFSDEPQAGTSGAAAAVVSARAIRGDGDAARTAREIAAPITKAQSAHVYNVFVQAMLKSNGPPPPGDASGHLANGGATADAFTKSLSPDALAMLRPSVPPQALTKSGKQASSDLKMLEGFDYPMLRANS